MAKWKKWGMFAGSLLGVGGFLQSASAQLPGIADEGGFPNAPTSRSVFTGLPRIFPSQQSQGGPNVGAPPTVLTNDGTPNAFMTDDRPPPKDPPYVFTLRGEYLLWRTSHGRLSAPLITTSTAPSVPGDLGALGQPSTVILLNKGDYDYNNLDGGRVTMGMAFPWMVPFEISGFGFSRKLNLFSETSDGSAGTRLLARPVQLVDPANVGAGNIGTESSFLIAVPQINVNGANFSVNGSVSVTSELDFWQGDVTFLSNFFESDALTTDFLLGYQHTDLTERLNITQTNGPSVNTAVNFNGNIGLTNVQTTVIDQFETLNRFDGGVIGFRNVLTNRRISLIMDSKVAVGVTDNRLRIRGNSTLTQAVADRPFTTVNGGILAVPSNIGESSRSEFSIIPQVNAHLSFQLNYNFRVFAGYNLMYWSHVTRAGSHVSNIVDPRQIPTSDAFTGITGTSPTRPDVHIQGFIAQGFNFGFEIGF